MKIPIKERSLWFLRNDFGEIDPQKIQKSLLAICFSFFILLISKDLIEYQSATVINYELTEEAGFYQSETIKLIYPPDFLQLEESDKQGIVIMTSITEKDSDFSSFPRIDSLLISSTMFLGDMAEELDTETKNSVFQELAYTIIASYYGDDVVGLDSNVNFAGLPAELVTEKAEFGLTEAKGYIELKVDSYKGLPEMLFRVSLQAIKGKAALSILATHDTINPSIETLFIKVFESIELQDNSEIVENLEVVVN